MESSQHVRGSVKKVFDVVGAVILSDGKILCAQRGATGALGGMWEFPGGKVEPGESPRQALEREIAEELQCEIEVGDVITTTRHEYDFAVIILTTFYCCLIAGEPELTEHQAAQWLSPSELAHLDWAAADIPAVQLIQATYV